MTTPPPPLRLLRRPVPAPNADEDPRAGARRLMVAGFALRHGVPRPVTGGVVVDDGQDLRAVGSDGSSRVLGPASAAWRVGPDGSVVVVSDGRALRFDVDGGPAHVLAEDVHDVRAIAVSSGERLAWWSEGFVSWRHGHAPTLRVQVGDHGRMRPSIAWSGGHVVATSGPGRREVVQLDGERVVSRWRLPGPVVACAASPVAAVVLAMDLEAARTVAGFLEPDRPAELLHIPSPTAWDGGGDRCAWVDEAGRLHSLDVTGALASRALPVEQVHGIGVGPRGRHLAVWDRPTAQRGASVWVVDL